MASSVMGPLRAWAQDEKKTAGANRMTYRVQHGSGEQISLLGFGMMRLPNNQEEVNQLVDYAIEHGVNYFDTAPMYMGGQSEVLTGNALSRHPRDRYYIATKMSNQNQRLWSFEESQKMYYQSFQRLKVDPAVASGPFITTVNDLVAVVSYYGLAWILLINVLKLV